MTKATTKPRSDAGVKKWTPLQAGRFYLRSMRERRITPLKYFGWLVEAGTVKDTPMQRQMFFNCVRLAALELAAVPGAVVIVPHEPSKIPWPALVVKYDGHDGTLTLRTKRCPTRAEVERGDYDPWVKTAKRYLIEQVIRVKSIPEPANAEAGVA